MNEVTRLIMLNQMAGPLFCELAEGLSHEFVEGVVLHTGHPDVRNIKNINNKVQLATAPTYNRKSNLTRILSWLSYLLSSSKLILFAKKSDGFLLSSNPPILGILFWLLSFFKSRPYIVLVYDVHPDILVDMGVVRENNILVKLWHWLNRKVYRDAASVVTLGRYMARRLALSNHLDSKKINIIPPWVDTKVIHPIIHKDNPLASKFNPKGKRVVLYSGNMGISHDIDTMLKAAALLRDRADILFLFIGGGDKYQTVVDYQTENQLDNIAVYPYQSESDLPYTMALADISLVTLGAGAQALMIPSKMFYYMASGSAIIGISPGENELEDIISAGDCGICVTPGDAQALAESIDKLLHNPEKLAMYGYNARKLAVNKYDKEAGIRQFAALFSK